MDTFDHDAILTAMHPECRVSIIEARELSWRMFYHDVGGVEGIAKIEGTEELGKKLKSSEDYFLKIMEDDITEEELKNLIGLPPTTIWVEDMNNPLICLKETKS